MMPFARGGGGYGGMGFLSLSAPHPLPLNPPLALECIPSMTKIIFVTRFLTLIRYNLNLPSHLDEKHLKMSLHFHEIGFKITCDK